MSSNVSYDLIWELARPYSTYLVKRRNAGGVSFSREALNVSGYYRQNASGFANPTAVGVVNSKNGIQLHRQTAKSANKPGKAVAVSTFKASKPARKIALAVSKNTVGHRDDLLEGAVLKASALARARKAKKAYASKARR